MWHDARAHLQPHVSGKINESQKQKIKIKFKLIKKTGLAVKSQQSLSLFPEPSPPPTCTNFSHVSALPSHLRRVIGTRTLPSQAPSAGCTLYSLPKFPDVGHLRVEFSLFAVSSSSLFFFFFFSYPPSILWIPDSVTCKVCPLCRNLSTRM